VILLHSIQTANLDQILTSPYLAGATVCVTVADENGNVVYDHNGGNRVAPASNEKLFSAAFALYELGPEYRPATKFWVAKDRITVESGGDPTLSHEDLTKSLAFLGCNRELPVYVKQAYDPEIPSGWEYGDLPNRYAAPVAAFSVDQSGFELWNINGRLQLRPQSYGVKIQLGSRSGVARFHYDPIGRVVVASGKFPKKMERLDTLAVPNAALAASMVIGKGFVATDEEPAGDPTYIFEGRPLKEDLSRCLQHSDNNMAENLLLMGAKQTENLNIEHPYPQALVALQDFETRVAGLSEDDLAPKDGSGLTRSNMVTTRAIVSLLSWAKSQATSSLWVSSLASPGVGTLISRLHGIDFHGKTGSLSHVTALSGYLTTAQSKKLVVSFILNDFNCSDSQAHRVIDKFIGYLSRGTP
jgi:D-alanyl-D-alanine carboxypeptidase/D-alanyl-D-alanine-endopeptidase (penicillin-binding protein 4)